MIRLSLTMQQGDQLHGLLSHLVQKGSETDRQHAHQLLALLTAAQQAATLLQQCPICQRTFTPSTAGRTGVYCSPACKQKAYRQRKRAWRQRRPPQP